MGRDGEPVEGQRLAACDTQRRHRGMQRLTPQRRFAAVSFFLSRDHIGLLEAGPKMNNNSKTTIGDKITQNVLSTQKLFKTRDLELPFFRDLSRVVRRTPRDTPVPLYTRTSPWPILHAFFSFWGILFGD